ncbi:hypothetical protein BB561_000466 [Smittium simulii]|uniref:Uncharacterized protein n=1 Tax=Smittium simulii TaxID=133385 RepID=A0A2T9YZ68_9FUNG|nr:hypothetical protein BB561_000466 [Smittium simulii]
MEVSINADAADDLIEEISKLPEGKVVTDYNPIRMGADRPLQDGTIKGLTELRARLKWQSLDVNRNIPARRMARIINGFEGSVEEFKTRFLERDKLDADIENNHQIASTNNLNSNALISKNGLAGLF